MNHKQLPDHLVFLSLHGSRAYGTFTPTSDWDVRGVGIAPLRTYFGTRPWEQLHGGSPFLEKLLYDKFPQADTGEELDAEVFNMTKFVRLAADANPNILDILFAHPDDWLFHHPVWDTLYEKRHMFLSMRVRYTYTGYAMSQLKRIKTHRKWLLEPPKQKPSRADFGLPETHSLVPKDIQDLAESILTKKQQEWQLDGLMERLNEEERDDVRDALKAYFEMVHGEPYNPHHAHEREQAAIQANVDKELFRRLEAERNYKQARNHWKQYQGWLRDRNPDRAALEKSFGFDCYDAESTEFLTQQGWKYFDQIEDTELLATVDIKTGELEFQQPLSKTDHLHTGIMYAIESYGSRAVITPNHKLLVSPARRRPTNNFSVKYDESNAAWQLLSMNEIKQMTRSVFHTRLAPAARSSEFDVSDDYLALAGLYLSEGTAQFRKSPKTGKTFKAIRLVQKSPGKFWQSMKHLEKVYSFRRYDYEKETIWMLHGKVAKKIYEDFGHAKTKSLPAWCFQLSARQADLFWAHLMQGDGTETPQRQVYYTSLAALADDLQASMVAAGNPCTVLGPYLSITPYGTVNMYHVTRSKKSGTFRTLYTSRVRKESDARPKSKQGYPIKELHVENQRVVCYEVPAGTLVTRNKGKTAIHGNCKHASHLVRLLLSVEEILTTGDLSVRHPQADLLRDVRNGAWGYDQLMEWSEAQEAKIHELAASKPLPHSPDRDTIDDLITELIMTFHSAK